MKVKYVQPKSLVIYHNKFNRINLCSLSALENNLLFSIFRNMRYNDLDFLFEYDEIKEMIACDYNNISNKDVKSICKNLEDKFFNIRFDIIMPNCKTLVHLFSMMKLHTDEADNLIALEIRLNPDARDIFQNLKREFTSFDLRVFTTFKSKYSKSVFRLLSQYSSVGKYKIDYNEFREYLGVPETYEYFTFNQKIMSVIKKDLSDYFKNLEIKVIKGKENGKTIHKAIEFTFKAYKISSNDSLSVEVPKNKNKTLFALRIASEELNKIANTKATKGLDYSREQSAISVLDETRYKHKYID